MALYKQARLDVMLDLACLFPMVKFSIRVRSS